MDRLIVLLHLMIFGGIGAGVGLLVGHVETGGIIGAVIGLAMSFPAMARFDKMVERGERMKRRQQKPRKAGPTSRN